MFMFGGCLFGFRDCFPSVWLGCTSCFSRHWAIILGLLNAGVSCLLYLASHGRAFPFLESSSAFCCPLLLPSPRSTRSFAAAASVYTTIYTFKVCRPEDDTHSRHTHTLSVSHSCSGRKQGSFISPVSSSGQEFPSPSVLGGPALICFAPAAALFSLLSFRDLGAPGLV